ncbi:hypothetical protein B0A49_04657 [Cryomyces minteri]|uniref:Separin n=1 Tax=Cryomyces minteri TaxID=331657 RepID=A0A4U0WZS4_9PEZI|nr:hypothetical protein B0A49_04657 [Cryomyces minteri]
MAPAQVQADTIRTALSSTSSCSSSTVTTLQTLLGSVPKPPKIALPPSKRALKSATTTVALNTATHRIKTVPKARSKSRVAVTVEVLEDGVIHSVLAPKEKLMLATEVVNASLKTLTDALKPQPKSHRRVSSTKNNPLNSSNHAKTSSSPTGARALTRTPSLTQRPLQPRSVSELCNSPTSSSSLRRSASDSSAQHGPAPCIVATAECARLAFAYLRSAQTEKTGAQAQPVLQLETGMLALVGKLVAHGLESLANQELRILKQRLEGFMVLENRQGTKHGDSVVGRTCPSTLEPETLAGLLHFEHINPESPALPLLVSYQMLVLKIIANTRRPAVIEAILEDLELSAACSPANVVLSYAKEANTKAKAAKQLESLVQTFLSLCPSTSSTFDQAASNIKINAPPEVTLQIQSLAFQVRRLWWQLAEHYGKDETEIMEPFAKCLAAFIRRSDAPPASKYRTAAQALEPLYGSMYSSPQQWTGLPPRFTVCKIIGSLAHAARQTQDAIMWTQLMVDMCVGSAASDAKRAACIIRRTALMLEDGITTLMSKSQVSEVPDVSESSHKETEAIRTQRKLHGCLSEALGSLGSSLRGDSADLDFLFEEVAGLRRAVVQALSLCAQPGETFGLDLHQQYRAVVFACFHFLTRYLGSSPAKDADGKLVRRHEVSQIFPTIPVELP